MVEKRNRNGGRDREDDRDDDEQGPVEAEARHVQEAPQTKPAVQAKAGMGAGTRLVLLLLIIALAGLGYRYWGFWQAGPTEATAPPPPGRHRGQAAGQGHAGVERFHRPVRGAGIGRGASAGERLPRIHQFHRRPDWSRRAICCSSSSRAPSSSRSRPPRRSRRRTKRSSSSPRRNSSAPRNCARTITPRKETYDERVAQVNIATASRDAAIAAVNQAQLNLDYTRVTAPVSGRMGRHEVSVGNLIDRRHRRLRPRCSPPSSRSIRSGSASMSARATA